MKHLATEHDGIELLYRGSDITNTPFSDISNYNKFCDELELLPLSDETFISKDFNIPQHYKELDVEKFIYSKIPASGQDVKIITDRVEMELELYKERNLFPIIQVLLFVVDILRRNDLVWGVGRGSSVASYILYLIGIHKVDSIKYNLDIREFLKR